MSVFGVKLDQKKWGVMSRKRYTVDQIILRLEEAKMELSQGKTVGHIASKLGIAEQTYYRWRREYGGLKIDQTKRLKELEYENARLKHLVADLSLDKEILKDAASVKF